MYRYLNQFISLMLIAVCLALTPAVSFSTSTNNSLIFQVVQDQLILDKSTIKNASLVEEKDGSFGGLEIEINPFASKKFERMTTHAIGKEANIVLNNKIISTAILKSPLANKFLIKNITNDDAKAFIGSLK